MSNDKTPLNRRRMLTVLGSVGATVLAGCSSTGDNSTPAETPTTTQTETTTTQTSSETPTETPTETQTTTTETQTSTQTTADVYRVPPGTAMDGREYDNLMNAPDKNKGTEVYAIVEFGQMFEGDYACILYTPGVSDSRSMLLNIGEDVSFEKGQLLEIRGTFTKIVEEGTVDLMYIDVSSWSRWE